MNDLLSIFLAALCIFAGQLIRAVRVRLIYGKDIKASFRIILSSIIGGSVVNLLVPFRIGDLMRIMVMNLDRNVTLVRATSVFVIDRLTDVTVLFLFSLIALYHAKQNLSLTLLLLIILFTLCLAFAIAFLAVPRLRHWTYERLPNSMDRHRERFQFGVYWMISRIVYCFSSINFILLTLLMWALYFGGLYLAFDQHSLATLVGAVANADIILETDIARFASLESESNGLLINLLSAALGALLVLGRTLSTSVSENLSKKCHSAITSSQSHLFLLEGLFSNRSDFISCVLMRDVNLVALAARLAPPPLQPLNAHSGGSGAIIVSFLDGKGKTWIRKYAERGDLCRRLEQQFHTISELSHLGLPMSKAQNLKVSSRYTKYDMSFSGDFVPFPAFASNTTMAGNAARGAVMEAIEKICELGTENADAQGFQPANHYIRKKLISNLKEAVERSTGFTPELKTPRGGEAFSLLLDQEWCERQISYEMQSTIHGDPTLENLIIKKDGTRCLWIDPNPNQDFSTVLMDMGKLMQSLHYGYDFHEDFLQSRNVDLAKAKQFKPGIYHELERDLRELVSARFGVDGLRETYFHEIVHYARLVNYKFHVSRFRGDQYLKLLEKLVADYVTTYDR